MGYGIVCEDYAGMYRHFDVRVTDMGQAHPWQGLVDQPHTVPDNVDAVVGCIHSG